MMVKDRVMITASPNEFEFDEIYEMYFIEREVEGVKLGEKLEVVTKYYTGDVVIEAFGDRVLIYTTDRPRKDVEFKIRHKGYTPNTPYKKRKR